MIENTQNFRLSTKTEKNNGGKVREATKNLHENFCDLLVNNIPGCESRIGRDDFHERTIQDIETGEELKDDKIQVDRHIYKNEKIHSFIEVKTYLDAAFLRRAASDFVRLWEAVCQKESEEYAQTINFIILAGQNSVSDDAVKVANADFYKQTQCRIKIVYLEEGKRSSDKPLHANKFPLDEQSINTFIDVFI